jgi:hypothetical protein
VDPYLENPELWSDVHNGLIAALRDELSPRLRPGYYVALEERTYLEEPGELVLVGRPDLTVVDRDRQGGERGSKLGLTPTLVEVELPVGAQVRETFLEVRATTEGDVVTVVELLSPGNKRSGTGRRVYLDKRELVLSTHTSLVELDLLRAGEPMPTVGPRVRSDYSILVSRGYRRPKADLIPFGVRDRIPSFPLPLRRGEDELTVDLGRVLHALYDRASYDLRIDYGKAPVPPLPSDDADWANDLIREHGTGAAPST